MLLLHTVQVQYRTLKYCSVCAANVRLCSLTFLFCTLYLYMFPSLSFCFISYRSSSFRHRSSACIMVVADCIVRLSTSCMASTQQVGVQIINPDSYSRLYSCSCVAVSIAGISRYHIVGLSWEFFAFRLIASLFVGEHIFSQMQSICRST